MVITGASSGIGRATAVAFARSGAQLILCSRSESALAEAAAECRACGPQVIAAPADVRNQEELNSVRSKAVQAFGRIDVWVNCAAVLSFGRFEDISPEIFRRVIETNVLGYGNGARAALAQFSTQGDCGTLINVSSMLAVVGEPYVSAYVATKFAIRGLTACLRQETENRPNIHVCAVLPAAVDTPIYQKAGNVFGRKARSIFPVYSPERVADAIVSAADRPRREVMVGGFAYVLKIVEKIAPMLLERLIARLAPRLQFQQEPQPASDGNIFVAAEPEAMKGRWKSYWMTRLRR